MSRIENMSDEQVEESVYRAMKIFRSGANILGSITDNLENSLTEEENDIMRLVSTVIIQYMYPFLMREMHDDPNSAIQKAVVSGMLLQRILDENTHPHLHRARKLISALPGSLEELQNTLLEIVLEGNTERIDKAFQSDFVVSELQKIEEDMGGSPF